MCLAGTNHYSGKPGTCRHAAGVDCDRLRDLDMVMIWRQSRLQQPMRRIMGPDQEAIELLLAGRGWLRVPGGWREVGPGDLLWHGGGEACIERSDPQHPYVCLALRVRVDPAAGRPAPRWSRWTSPVPARVFAREALDRFADPACDRRTLLLQLYAALLLEATRSADGQDQPGALTAFRRLAAARCGDRSVYAFQLARQAGCSQSQIHRLCRRHLGCTPQEVLRRCRLEAARRRIAAGERPLAAVARAAGFSSASTLCRAWRTAYGCSPLSVSSGPTGTSSQAKP